MSDLCMYELEDIVWDDFCQSDDHIVPHHSDEQDSESLVHGNNRKKPREKVSCVASDAGEPINEQKTDQETLTLYDRRNKMLEKEAWSHKPNGVFHSSCDKESIKEMSSLASDNTKTSSHCHKSNPESVGSELCANNSILNDKSTEVNNSFGYPLDHISEADNVSFFGNSHEDKDSSDLLYYGWPDIGNFEDVDRMFRSCDSTFGLGASNEDDLGWFSSSDAIGGSEDALKSDIKFSCPESSEPKSISETREPSSLNGTSNESTMQNISVMYKDNSWPSSKDESSPLGYMSFSNGSNCSDGKDGFMPEGQEIEFKAGVQLKISNNNHAKNLNNEVIKVPKKQLKLHYQSEMERKGQYLENDSFFSIDHMPEIVRQQRQALETDSFGYLQSDIPYICSEYSHPSDQTSVRLTPSAAKLENSSLTSLSPKDSYASNKVKSMEGSNDPSFQVISISSNEKREKLHHQQGFQASFDNKNVDLAVQTSKGGPILLEKKVHYSGNEFENHTDDNGVNLGIPAELGSSVVQESSSMKSGLDDISVEATSFRQLQLVMERLDLRTKLCIRDSLYRLARSAEQRHTCEKLSGGHPVDGDAGGALVAEGKHKYTGFMDIETDTNPIDRSVAHLLFHRPSDSSVTPGNDSASFNSPTLIHGSINSSPMMAEGFVKREETAGETDRKIAGN